MDHALWLPYFKEQNTKSEIKRWNTLKQPNINDLEDEEENTKQGKNERNFEDSDIKRMGEENLNQDENQETTHPMDLHHSRATVNMDANSKGEKRVHESLESNKDQTKETPPNSMDGG